MNEEQPHLTFFMDDFGTRTMCKPDDTLPMEAHIFSFGLGGIIVPSEAVQELSDATIEFCKRWEVPELHGNKIRSGKGKFGFLKKDEERRNQFFEELEALIIDDRITAHACVICRPGYRDRYYEKHTEGSRWEMSRTAFDIAVERGAKYARLAGRKLSIAYERTGATEDRLIESYFEGLLKNGTGFDGENSSKHKPLTKDELAETLLTIWPDGKSNPMLQLADLVVHPLGHRPTGLKNRAYDRLSQARQIIDLRSGGDETIAVKYSCYDEPYKEWVNPRDT
ncbi:hypothetical protein FHT70_002579 [Rhizobium sp. BK049]|uniref:DUF3800 domain-containing protein n=1 Tax=Rhizobium sp. BK049 TaxID=2587095 RepID=UPI001850EF44|nr:hypothetical protein [Rhizobium sp. BK049]